MKRRHVIPAMLGIPAAMAQTPPALPPPPKQAIREELPKTPVCTPDAVGPSAPHFFSAPQLAALARLAEIIAPSTEETPGAKEAGVAEFLDFLIGCSPEERRTLYTNGLDRLNAHKPFAELSAEQADALLAPLHQPWTYDGPADPFARFLLAAKDDILTATVNSREWIQAVSARRRGAGGVGQYWLPIE